MNVAGIKRVPSAVFQFKLVVLCFCVFLLCVWQVSADCEVCVALTSEDDDSAQFEIDEISDITDDMFPYLRVKLKPYTGRVRSMGVSINSQTESYEHCDRVEYRQLRKKSGDVSVTCGKRSLVDGLECTGDSQTSIRLAHWPHELDLGNDSVIDVSFDTKAAIKEVCVGFEGDKCNITGNGESYQRCYLRPTMEDGCNVDILHSNQTLLITHNHNDTHSGHFNESESDDDGIPSLQISDFDTVYLGSTMVDLDVFVSDISDDTMVELMTSEHRSVKQLTLVNTHRSTVHLTGDTQQTAQVSAVGDTDLQAFILNYGHWNRIQMNARCANSLDLTAVFRGTPYFARNRWMLRVGCPEDPSKLCRITNTRNSNAKQVFVANKQAWMDESVRIKGKSRVSFTKGFAAFYSDDLMTDESCCYDTICDFKQQCQLRYDGGGRFIWDKFCRSFVLSIYVPFVHFLISLVFLCLIGILSIRVIHDEKIQKSRHIKMIVLSLIHSGSFGACWMVYTIIQAHINHDWFQEIRGIRPTSVISYTLYLLLPFFHPLITSDIRYLQFSLIQELSDLYLTQKGQQGWSVDYGKMWNIPLIQKYIAVIFLLSTFFYGTIFFYFMALFMGFISVCILCLSFRTGFPDYGQVCFFVVLFMVYDDTLDDDLVIFLPLFLWHFWDVLLVWALIFQFATGKGLKKSWYRAYFMILKQLVSVMKLCSQMFDLLSDVVVIAFFIGNGSWILAMAESSFVLSAIMVSTYGEWNEMPHPWQRIFLIIGLGRIVEITDPSFSDRSGTFLSEVEMHLESLPSLIFGTSIVLTAPREDTGPILFSMGVTWMTLALKAIKTVIKRDFPDVWKVLVFLTLLSDFFVRCISPALMIAVIQGQKGESLRIETVLYMLSHFLVVFGGYLCYYYQIYADAVRRSPYYLRALISTISIRPALFAYLRMDHYENDAVIATSLDLIVLTIPHLSISVLFSIVAIVYLWDVFPGLSVATLLFSLIQMGCIMAMWKLSKDGFVSTDVHSLETKNRGSVSVLALFKGGTLFDETDTQTGGEPDKKPELVKEGQTE